MAGFWPKVPTYFLTLVDRMGSKPRVEPFRTRRGKVNKRGKESKDTVPDEWRMNDELR